MICPECQKENQKSEVTQGCSSMTLMYHTVRYDENGRMIPNLNPNTMTTSYSCSNGHVFTRTS